jgi:hypothetical protein
MTSIEAIAVHQLLGRLVYFHVLFIEPKITPSDPKGSTPNDSAARLTGTAWAALDEIARSLPDPGYESAPSCDCDACDVRCAAAKVAAQWIDVENHAYAHPRVQDAERQQWTNLLADRMASVFADEHPGHVACTACDSRPVLPTALPPPAPDRLPLTAELLDLWSNPTGSAPVVSWLNHCTTIDDIARVLMEGLP